EGEPGLAYTLYREGMTVAQTVLGRWGLAMPLAGFCHLAASQGQPLRAVRLGAAATALRETHHTPLIPIIGELLVNGLERARQALDETSYAAAWAEGRALSLEGSIAEALAEELATAAMPPDTTPAAGST